MADPLDRVKRIIRGLTMAQHVKKAGVPAAQAPETEARVRLKFRVRCIVEVRPAPMSAARVIAS